MASDASRLSRIRTSVTAAPAKPGVYRWRDAKGDVLYVGKAKNLRSRLRSYLPKRGGAFKDFGPWKQSMMGRAHDVDTTVTSSELEAFVLETNLIKTIKPKYNVLMKDDKNYVYVRISAKDPFPDVGVIRRMEDDGALFFGPFLSAFDTRRLLDALHEAYPYKASKQTLTTLNRRAERGEDVDAPIFDAPPLSVQIGKECGLGTGTYSQAQYRSAIDQLVRFFRGDRKPALQAIRAAMDVSAQARQFERAALLRDALRIIQDLEERQSVSDTTGSNADIVGVALQGDRAHVVVMHERGGKLIGEQSVPLRGAADSEADVLEQFLPQYYAGTPDIPETVVIGAGFDEQQFLASWLAERRGQRVAIIVPQRGKRAQQLHLAHANARAKLLEQLARWEAAAQNIEHALEELQSILQLPKKPERAEGPALSRIEGYDISHLGGTETVGSMVVMRRGKPVNDLYRSFTIRTLKEGQVDDYAALREVLRRRLKYVSGGLREEVRRWREKGVIIRKARKADRPGIEALIKTNPQMRTDDLDQGLFVVAVKGEKVIACGRFFDYPAKLRELRSVCVIESQRGNHLGQTVIRWLLTTQKHGRVYAVMSPHLEEYYAELGFRHILKTPPVLKKRIEALRAKLSRLPEPMILMFDPVRNKMDPSLSVRPDLLVVDGGKGQLSAAVEVLRDLQLQIPVIGLAKREEDVFRWDWHTSPLDSARGGIRSVTFENDSRAKFLLMRLRDEAHRFANRHREQRGAKHSVQSVLDIIPGIGSTTKQRLLDAFGTLAAIREAPDEKLLSILTQRQLQELRRHL